MGNRLLNIHLLQFFLLNVLPFAVVSQQSDLSYKINPFIRNFSQTEYKGANQNWGITQDNDGFIYVANGNSVLEYNGSSWKRHYLKSSHLVRSVFAANDGRIYYGHFEDFGYFERNEFGELEHVSLSDSLIKPTDIANNNIWSITKIGDKIYFRSFNKVFIYDGKSIEIYFPKVTIYNLFEYKNKPYINLLNSGLFYFDKNNSVIEEKTPPVIRTKRFISIFPKNEKQDIIVTEFSGLFLKENNNYITWECPANNKLKEYQINKCISVNKDLIVIGTIGNGLFLINSNGEIINHIDKSSGLQNNTVLSILSSQSKNLWIGLDNGIDFIEIDSPYLFCNDRVGILGSVYCTSKYKNKLYVGTNQGLFYTNWDDMKIPNNVEFKQVEEVKGQVWNINILDDKLICNHNLGILQIDETGVKQIGETGGFIAVKHPNKKNIFYQGNYTGILLFKKNQKGDWQKGKWIDKLTGGVKYLQIDQLNNLWVGRNFKNALVLSLNNRGDSVLSSKAFGSASGFNDRWNIGVYSFENRIIFSNNNKFYTYNYSDEAIKPYNWLNSNLELYKTATHVFKTDDNEYWFSTENQLAMFSVTGDKLVKKKEIKYELLHASAVDNYQNIRKLNNKYYILGLDNGFAIYNCDSENKQQKSETLKLKLLKATCSNSQGQIETLKVKNISSFEIPFKFRNIKLYFSIPGKLLEKYSIRYKTDNNKWHSNILGGILNLNYLKQGNHKFQIMAFDENGIEISNKIIDVKILPPWYLNIYALLCYLLIISIIIYSIFKINQLRLKKQKLVYLRKIKTDNTKRIIKMKNQHLQNEIRNKSKELVNYTVLLGRKNEVLIQIKEKFSSFLNTKKENNKNEVKEIFSIINQNLTGKDEWQIFSAHFNDAHSDFVKKIKIDHPELTPNDLKLCAFLKMNLSSKEIALLLNISFRSIEMNRYRLRKKLGLNHNKNLVEYLLEI